MSSHQSDYTNSVGKRMQGAGKGTKLGRAQTKNLLKFGGFFFLSRMCSSEVGRSSGQPTKARCCGFERGTRAYGAFVQKKNVFLINSRRDGSCVIPGASHQIRWDHSESFGIFSLREKNHMWLVKLSSTDIPFFLLNC